MKKVHTRLGRAAWHAVAALTAAVVIPLQSLALPVVTAVVETGGDNEATDTIPAKFTGQTWTVSVANEPVPGAAIGNSYTVGVFGEDVPCFVDRNHQWNGATANLPIPHYFLGAEYIMPGNDNRDNAGYQLDITVSEAAAICMLIDNRYPTNKVNTTPPNYETGIDPSTWINALAWMGTGGFKPVKTGWNRAANSDWPDEIGCDEGGNGTGPGGDIQQFASIYSVALAGPGTVSIYQPDNAGRNMYGVVVVPLPPAPADLSAASLNQRVGLTWASAPFAISYNIKRSDTQGGTYTTVGTTTTTSFIDSGLVNFQDYYYVVSAVGLAGEGSDSAEVIGTPKSSPQDLVAQGGTKQITLTWSALADTTSYTVKRAVVSGGPYAEIAAGLTDLTYVDDELPDGQRFYYTVSAVYTGGGDSANADEAFALTAPNVPVNFTAQRFAATVLRLDWTIADQLPATTSTVIEESSDGTTFAELATIANGGKRYYDIGIAPSTTVYYRARATNSGGTSEYTAVTSANTPATGINVNFADAAVTNATDYPIPGYLDDFGLVFADQGNGYSYGWDTDNSANDRVRNSALSPDRRYDTLNHLQKVTGTVSNFTWEVAVPNGLYLVHIVGGDATATDSVFQWNVEGYISKTLSAAAGQNWKEFTLTVPVADEKLTITSGPSAANNKVCFVDIYPTEASANEFVTQPASQTANVNRSVTFSVAVSGPEPYTLQWRFNGNPIEGATNEIYTIARVQSSDAGAYSVVVNNPGNVPATSADATLTVTPLPTLWDIVAADENFSTLKDAIEAVQIQGLLQGDAFLTAFAPPNDAFAALPTETANSLLADTNLLYAVLGYHVLAGEKTAADLVPGSYATLNGASVAVTTPEGAVKVNDATVVQADVFAANGVAHVINQVLLPPPLISTQPAPSTTVYIGETVTLSVETFGVAPFSYQWAKGGVDIDGATAATLTLSNAQLADSGTYTVRVTNPGGTVTSSNSVVTISRPTLWMIVSDTPELSTLEAAIDAADLETALQGTDPLTAFAPDNDAFAALPEGTVDALLANKELLTAVLTYHVLGGTKLAADLVAGNYATLNGASVTVTTPEGLVKVNDATVTAADILANNGVAHIIDQVLLPPPVISTQPPATAAGYVGDTITLSVTAFGVDPITYQWTKGGVDVDGATAATLTLNNAQEADSGTYAVRVTNPGGTATSNNSVVTIAPIPEPPVITTQPQATVAVYVGGTATLSVVATGEGTITYQWTKGGTDIDGATSASLVLADAQESDSGTYAVKVSNRGGTTTSENSVVTVSVKPPTLWQIVSTNSELSTLKTAIETAGLQSVLDEETDDPLTVFAPNNDAFAALPADVLAALLANPEQLAGVLTYHAIGGTQLSTSLVPGDYPTLANGALVTVTTNATAILVNNATVLTPDVLAINGVAHVINQVLVPVAPSVSRQPPSAVVASVGDNVTLTVGAAGTKPFSYQWTKGVTDIEGATSATLVLNSVQTTGAGTYAVKITSPVGSVTSTDSVLSVYEVEAGKPQIMFVSFHVDDNIPDTDAANAGFLQAPDVGYTALLKANGYPVARVLTSGTPDTNLLNTAGLVIISRSVPSGDYQDAPETAAWNGITAPTLLLNGYILRDSRLGFTTGGTMVDTTNTVVTLKVNNPTHPLFAGIELNAENLMVNPYANRQTFNGLLQNGISVNTNALESGGIVLATSATPEDPTLGGPVAAEWPAGAVVNGGIDTLGGHRLVLLTGSRESGITSHGAGIFDLAADGTTLFLNAVAYMTRAEIEAPVIADGKITITWSGAGVLETATDINGPWTEVTTTGGTYTEDVGTGNKYYRVTIAP